MLRHPAEYYLIRKVDTEKMYRLAPEYYLPTGYEYVYKSHNENVYDDGRLRPQYWALERIRNEKKR